MNVLIGTTPMVLGIREILMHWTEFRMNCIKRKLKYDLDKISTRLHLLEGLKKILLDIDKAIAIIRNTERDDDVVPNLMKGFGIDEEQADFIAEIKLRNLNKQYILNRLNDIDDLKAELDNINRILADDKEVKKLIIEDLKRISKKYGKERKTTVVESGEIPVYEEESFIEDYNLKIFLTNDGYLKKISAVSLRSSSAQKLKDGDFIVLEQETTNKADLVLISNMCNAYKLKLHEVADCKASDWGHFAPNIAKMEQGEKIVFAIATVDYDGDLLYFFENGKVARVNLKSYETKTNRKKLINAYSDKSKLVTVKYITDDTDMVIYSSIDKVMVFSTTCLNPKTTRDTQGVAVMNMKKKSVVTKVDFASDAKLSDIEYYKTKNVPATGYYLKDEDNPNTQLSLF